MVIEATASATVVAAEAASSMNDSCVVVEELKKVADAELGGTVPTESCLLL
jgi:hypothetical protein